METQIATESPELPLYSDVYPWACPRHGRGWATPTRSQRTRIRATWSISLADAAAAKRAGSASARFVADLQCDASRGESKHGAANVYTRSDQESGVLGLCSGMGNQSMHNKLTQGHPVVYG